jgi:hypothetical protein
MEPPIIETVPTLQLVHRALKQVQRHPDENVSNLAKSVLSIVAFNLRHPVVKVTPDQKRYVEKLAEVVNGV